MLEPQLEGLHEDREVLVIILVIQALLEEFFFRGYLFGALRKQLSAAATIGISAVLFGLLHLVMGGALGWERLLPSTLLGLVLGWVRWTSGSVLPGMLLHACHNAILNLVPPTQEVPWTWLAAGAVGSCVGAAFVWWGRCRALPTAM